MPQSDIDRLYTVISEMRADFTDKWEQAIQQSSGIGSDVKDLKICFKEHLKEDRAFKEEIGPLLHGKRFFTYLHDFFKFWGIPSGAIIGIIWWIWNKL